MRFVHTNIISTNWKTLADFYIQTFQCKIIPPIRKQSGAWLDKGTGLKKALLQGVHLLLPGYGQNGPTLEIYQYQTIDNQKANEANTEGYRHIAFEVEDVENTLKLLISNGGASIGEVTTQKIEGVGILTFVYAKDPEGNIIELQSWKKESNVFESS